MSENAVLCEECTAPLTELNVWSPEARKPEFEKLREDPIDVEGEETEEPLSIIELLYDPLPVIAKIAAQSPPERPN